MSSDFAFNVKPRQHQGNMLDFKDSTVSEVKLRPGLGIVIKQNHPNLPIISIGYKYNGYSILLVHYITEKKFFSFGTRFGDSVL